MAARRTSKRRPTRSKAEREFVSEAEEILETMRACSADLGDDRPADAEPELVNRLFRSAHSLKALAAMFRFDPIESLAHRLEDILDGLRMGRVHAAPAALGLIDESTYLFGVLLEQVGNAEAMAESAAAIEDLTARIAVAAGGESGGHDDLAGLDVDSSLLRALTEYEEHRLRENLRRDRHVVLVDATFDISAFEEGLSALITALRETGEVISTLPAPGEAPESQIQFSLLVASALASGDLIERLDFPGASVHELQRAGAVSAPEVQETAEPQDPIDPSPPTSRPELESLRSISDTVRVDIRKLDELMNLVGELVIQRGALGDLLAQLPAAPSARVGTELGKVHKAIDRKLRELQSAVLDVRMVGLRQVFERVSRVVRRMQRERGLAVRLELRGADTELDKLIVEALVDPLMHVIRNVIDHAIESVDERRAAGKEDEARIRMEAFQRGNHVVIAVSDDGRGIDLEALRARAEHAGVVRPDDVLSERDTIDLVFAPGLSTSSEITETSGRGVGMDVVRENLTALGGVVDVDSTPGRGTTISMTLPITLAIVPSLIVSTGGQRFAVPLNSVLETLAIAEHEIQRSEGRELINLRGEALRLVRLGDEFGLASLAHEKPFAIVMGIGEQRVGLLVDGVEGQQDTVIKAIQGPVQAVRGIAGATELGDQEPVLVLDVSAFFDDAARRREVA